MVAEVSLCLLFFEVFLILFLCYNVPMNWNPLYPSNEEVSSLEEAMREAEWEDDLRWAENEQNGE